MDSGSTRLRLVETADGWELREPGRAKPLRTTVTRVKGLRAARAMLEFSRGGCVEIEAAGGEPEVMEFDAMTRQQRGRLAFPSRLVLAFGAGWPLLFLGVGITLLSDGEAPAWRQILLLVIAGAFTALWSTRAVKSMRHYRRPI